MKRILKLIKEILISLDQLAQVTIVGIFYIIHLVDVMPSADETISSYVGRAELRSVWWGKLLAPVIDSLFVLLGEPWGHCQRNVETAFLGKAPVA